MTSLYVHVQLQDILHVIKSFTLAEIRCVVYTS